MPLEGTYTSLQWNQHESDSVSNHQPHDFLLSRLFKRRSKKTPKLRVTGLGEGNSPVTGEFPTQRASNAENVSIWWRHHDILSSRAFIPWNNVFNIPRFKIRNIDRDSKQKRGGHSILIYCGITFTGDPLHSRAACTQPCNVNIHSRAHCSPGARLCEQWGHGCVNNGARLCASARLCRGSPVIGANYLLFMQRPICDKQFNIFGALL